MHILILTISLLHSTGQVNISSIEFVDQPSCNAAAAQWLRNMEQTFKGDARVNAMCVQKAK